MIPGITLFDLIRLNEGQLDQRQSDFVRDAISRDPQVAKQWSILRETYRRLMTASNSGMVTGESQAANANKVATEYEDASAALSGINQVASYLDQQLSPEEQIEFENKCWHQKTLLLEVLDCYQALVEANEVDESVAGSDPFGHDASPDAIRQFEDLLTDSAWRDQQRLNGLANHPNGTKIPRHSTNGVTLPALPQASKPDAHETDTCSLDTNPIKVNVQDSSEHTKQRTAKRRTRLTSGYLWWAVSAVATVLVIAWISFSSTGQNDSKIVDDSKIVKDPDRAEKKESSTNSKSSKTPIKIQPQDDSEQQSPDSHKGPGIQKDALTKENFPPGPTKKNSQKAIVKDSSGGKNPLEPPVKDAPDGNGNQKQIVDNSYSYPKETELGWRRIKGLVAVKNQYEAVWSTTNKHSSFLNQSRFRTFPGSWAEAKTAGQAVFVIDEDSLIELSAGKGGSRFKIGVMHGKAGFRSVAKGTAFEVIINGSLLHINSLEDDTEFGVDSGENGARLFVKKGAMRINGTKVEKGMQGSPASARTPQIFSFSTIKSYEDVRWLSKSQSKTNIPTQLRTKLGQSPDIERDLKQLLNSKNDMTKYLAVKWRLSMDNGASLVRLANSNDSVWRLAALEWLLELGVHEPRTKRIWRLVQDLAARNLNTVNPPNLYRWQLLPKKGNAPWPDRDVAAMKRLLDHRDWLFRALAFYYLENKFGNDVGYRPDLNTRQLRTAAQAWRRSIDAKHQLLKKSNR